MNPTAQRTAPPPLRRRYVVHLLCAHEETYKPCRHISRIRPWAARTVIQAEARERVFDDECVLIETINPLLPSGSDIRDVFSHIESPDGFFYVLCLSGEEARRLGWPEFTP
jgi:hypothetical protein